jgi:hypothetical protein
MQSDPGAIEPPLGEFSTVAGWIVLAGCIAGWVSCLGTLFRHDAASNHWLVWRRAFLVGLVVGVGWLFAAIRHAELDPFIGLLLDWALATAFAAGFLVFASRISGRRALGRRMLEAVAISLLGWPVPGLVAAAGVRLVSP